MNDENFGLIVSVVGMFLFLVFAIVAALTYKEPCVKAGGHWEQQNCVTRRHLVCKPGIKNGPEIGCHFEKRTTCDTVCVGATP